MPRVWNKRDPNVPPDAVYVGRPTRWGNPWKLGDSTVGPDGLTYKMDRACVIERYRQFITDFKHPERAALVREHLRGKDLVCWCAPKPCHADVLFEIANGLGDAAPAVREEPTK